MYAPCWLSSAKQNGSGGEKWIFLPQRTLPGLTLTPNCSVHSCSQTGNISQLPGLFFPFEHPSVDGKQRSCFSSFPGSWMKWNVLTGKSCISIRYYIFRKTIVLSNLFQISPSYCCWIVWLHRIMMHYFRKTINHQKFQCFSLRWRKIGYKVHANL